MSRPFAAPPVACLALTLSAALWAIVICLTPLVSPVTGYAQVMGQYLTLAWGAGTAVVIAWLIYLLAKLLTGRSLWLAVSILAPALLIAGALQMLAHVAGQLVVQAAFGGAEPPDSSWGAQARVALIYICIYAINFTLFWVTFTVRRVRDQQRLIADREAAVLRTELRVLRLQLNPHFMFNALSALSTLILMKRNLEAETMTGKLSEFLRAAMDVDALKDIRVVDELAVLEAYLAVERVRFGDRLILTIDCTEDAEEALVPNLLLQPIVENAMKYAVEPSTGPVALSILASRVDDRLCLQVRDSGAVVRDDGYRPSAGHGIGLTAVRQRLALCYAGEASLAAEAQEGGFVVTVELPFRNDPD